MHIAIVTPVFPPYRGGMGKVALEQAKDLAASGNDVTVFTPDYGRKVSADGYKLELIKPFFRFGNGAILLPLLWKLRGFDRIILHYPFFGSAELLLLVKPKAKLVILYHMDVKGKGLLGKFFRVHQRHIMPLILSRADKVIVTSLDYASSSAIKSLMAAKPEKFVEIPLGVDTEIFKPRPREAELAAKLKLAPEDRIILFVGGLDSAHYFKGVDVLLRAFKQFLNSQLSTLNSKLLIVGSGNLRPSYEKMAKELGVGDKAIFAGSASEDDLPKYYNLADLFILPSIDSSESFGLVILEAMASGVPVIASNLSGVRTLVKEGKTGYLSEPGNADDIALKIGKYFVSEGTLNVREDIARQVGEHYGLGHIREEWNKAIL